MLDCGLVRMPIALKSSAMTRKLIQNAGLGQSAMLAFVSMRRDRIRISPWPDVRRQLLGL